MQEKRRKSEIDIKGEAIAKTTLNSCIPAIEVTNYEKKIAEKELNDLKKYWDNRYKTN